MYIGTCFCRRDLLRTQRGLTLAEALVVIGVVVLLIGLLLPVLSSARAKARQVACAARLHDCGKAMAAYMSDNLGYLFPEQIGFGSVDDDRWAGYVLGEVGGSDGQGNATSDILVCPADPHNGSPNPTSDTRNSYLLNGWIWHWGIKYGGPYRGLSPTQIVVMGEKQPDAIGWNHHSAVSMRTSQGDWEDVIDLFRHGRRLRSNHLFLDLHVSNDPLTHHVPQVDPWYIPHEEELANLGPP